MKKVALLALVLIVALPGCGKKNTSQPTKRSTVERNVNMDSSDVVEIDEEDLEDLDLEDEDEDSEVESFNVNFDDEDELSEGQETIEAADEFTWIDAQDDEFKTLYFTFNHYGVRADQKQAVDYDLEQVKQLLSDSGTAAQSTVVIEGHACQEGSPAYNLSLSEKRAKNVADLFVAAGVDRSAIKVVGRGQECPVVNGATRDARELNRRVEIRVIYT